MSHNNKIPETNVFQTAVENTDDLKGGYRKGLQALKGNSLKVSITDKKKLFGSVDIDGCTKLLYPNASRWDYSIGYDQKAWFVEILPRVLLLSNKPLKRIPAI